MSLTTPATPQREPQPLETAAPPAKPMLDPAMARMVFIGLAVAAGLALLVAIVSIVLAPKAAVALLVVSLVVLVLVVIAEVVLLLVARPRNA